jgi:hypothetical protein
LTGAIWRNTCPIALVSCRGSLQSTWVNARLQLRSVESSHTLTHPVLMQVFHDIEKILDGRHTVAEIASSAGPDILPTTVVYSFKAKACSSLVSTKPRSKTASRRAGGGNSCFLGISISANSFAAHPFS